uniref:Uncharacterized protein n=1 Tax=Amphora coffeiformis TaxID=265554 RepID=A0A7S3KXG0_9STRA|mmetsp:Transcript_13296/g.25199  ORF Transcript_13296/g.25199 Transcript_13296/m.25199 type:complete len:261 (-) Transcript_13296:155-937(-)|eukprot:scaffold3648_cov149-Amphora_coffeaeformis.AAC.14
MMPEVSTTATAPSKNKNSNRRLTLLWVELLLATSLQKTADAFAVSSTQSWSTSYRTLSRSSHLMATNENAGPPEDDCGDECDIDWDAMPTWDDFEDYGDDDDDEVEAVFYPPNGENPATTKPQGPSVEQRRLHMEMQWQLTEAQDECEVEKPETCGSEACQDCNGKGWNDCRFCHGTAVLRMDRKFTMPAAEETPTTMAGALSGISTTTTQKKFILPSSFSACKICQQGVEMCRTCQGSGWVASWTQLPNAGRNGDPLLP